jgi:F-type H+-transporting ATPase subunit b
MLFDGFTFFAQVVNVLLLIALLRRFLFRPVMLAVGERERKLEQARMDAEERSAEALSERRRWEDMRAGLEADRGARLAAAESEARQRKEELLEAARNEAVEAASKWRTGFESERKAMQEELERRIRREAFALARKIVRGIADADLDEACVKAFLRELGGMDGVAASRFRQGGIPREPVVVRTSGTLSPALQDELRRSLRRILESDPPIRFEKDLGAAWGIEILFSGWSLSWTPEGSLEALEASVSAAGEREGRNGGS